MKILSFNLFPLLLEWCLFLQYLHVYILMKIHTLLFRCILYLCNSWNIPCNWVYLLNLFEFKIINKLDVVYILGLFSTWFLGFWMFWILKVCLGWSLAWFLVCVESACIWLTVQRWVFHCWNVYYDNIDVYFRYRCLILELGKLCLAWNSTQLTSISSSVFTYFSFVDKIFAFPFQPLDQLPYWY